MMNVPLVFKKTIPLLLFIVMALSSCAQSKVHQVIAPEEFKSQITEADVQLVDVRTPKEFKEGHIDGAINYNYLDTENFKKQIDSLDVDQPVYIYCRSGNRSGRAAKLMKEMGFTQIVDLKGGYLGWQALTQED